MKITIAENGEKASLLIATYIKDQIHIHQHLQDRNPFVLGLPTGSSIEKTYEYLVSFYNKGELSFKNVVTFNMDEYVGLGPDDSNSYSHFMYSRLFDKVDMKEEHINLLDGTARDIEAEVARYEDKISSLGGIDLFIGGMGANGHLAFNEPLSSFESATHQVYLTEDTMLRNSRFFGHDISKVPRSALSIGVKTFMSAKKIALIVLGYDKSQSLQKIIEEGVNNMYPASVVQMHKNALLFCDEAACDNLMVKTYKMIRANSEMLNL